MKNCKNKWRRALSLVLVLVLTVSMGAVGVFSANGSTVTATEKTYDIAVVFDNSGSMYEQNRTYWCSAKYAMEIFASMLDYQKDSLTIFPMWEVATDGSAPKGAKQESKQPVVIQSLEDINKITLMHTKNALGTPFTPVNKAYEYLSKSKKDEKWLVVLTDGEFDGVSKDKVQGMLSAKITDEIRLQYLGFGGAVDLKADEEKGFYVPKSSSIEEKLVEACNTIFQRSVLPAKYLKGKTLNVDLSMRKVIVFVQGKGAVVNGLTDESGNPIAKLVDSGQRKFSDTKYSAGNYSAKTDTSLYGQVITFDTCPKGEYTLDYTGDEKAVQIFYEPDVDIDIEFLNADGVKVEKPEDFYAGEYTVTSKILDKNTGEEVTDHELMGNNVSIKTYVKTSKDTSPKEYENGAKITFEPDDNTEIWVEGTYLGKYTVSTKDDPDWAWLMNLKVEEEKAKLAAEATVLQSGSWYTISEKDSWKPILVKLTLDGQPLTDEQLDRTALTATPDPALNYRVEKLAGQSAYNVYVAQDGNGAFVKPEIGGYDMNFSVTYTDEYGVTVNGTADVSFDVQTYSKWIRILIISAIVLAILALIAAFLLRPVLPKRIFLLGTGFVKNEPVRAGRIPPRWDMNAVPLAGRPMRGKGMCNSWLMSKLKPRRQNYYLTNLRSNRISQLMIDAAPYTFGAGGQMLDATGEEVTKIKISNGTSVSWRENRSGKLFEGEIKINRQ